MGGGVRKRFNSLKYSVVQGSLGNGEEWGVRRLRRVGKRELLYYGLSQVLQVSTPLLWHLSQKPTPITRTSVHKNKTDTGTLVAFGTHAIEERLGEKAWATPPPPPRSPRKASKESMSFEVHGYDSKDNRPPLSKDAWALSPLATSREPSV